MGSLVDSKTRSFRPLDGSLVPVDSGAAHVMYFLNLGRIYLLHMSNP